MSGQPDDDLLLELRDSLEEGDEPLFAPPSRPAAAAATPAKGLPPAAGRAPATGRYGQAQPISGAHPATAPVSAPPPLPPGKRPPATGPQPAVSMKTTAGYRPAPPGADLHPLPQTIVRPLQGQDPFQEPPEPRLAAGGDPEEKLKTFRLILKQKEETLARGRSLYKAVDDEALAVRAVAEKLRVELDLALQEAARGNEYPQQIQSLKEMLEKDTIRADDAEKRMDALVTQLAEGEAERKDLTQALAEVESQFTETNHRLEDERKTREALADELIGAKEALSTAQDRVADLGARASEAQGSLEATSEQLTFTSQELETAQLEAETLRQEVALSGELRAELEAATARVSELGEKLAEAEGKVTALEGEGEWSQSSLDQAQARVAELEQKTAKDTGTVDDLTRQVSKLTSELESAEAEKSDALSRAAELDAQLTTTRDALDVATSENEKLRGLFAKHDAELTRARSDTETAAVKKVRTELNQANQRAMESGATARKEKEQREQSLGQLNDANAKREAAEAKLRDLNDQLHAAQAHASAAEGRVAQARAAAHAEMAEKLKAAQDQLAAAELRASQSAKSAGSSSAVENKLKAVEEQLRATQTMKLVVEKELGALKATPPAGGGSSGAEVEKLRADLAVMKKKMATAESAIEAAASLKAKVARLENQLKAK